MKVIAIIISVILCVNKSNAQSVEKKWYVIIPDFMPINMPFFNSSQLVSKQISGGLSTRIGYKNFFLSYYLYDTDLTGKNDTLGLIKDESISFKFHHIGVGYRKSVHLKKYFFDWDMGLKLNTYQFSKKVNYFAGARFNYDVVSVKLRENNKNDFYMCGTLYTRLMFETNQIYKNNINCYLQFGFLFEFGSAVKIENTSN